MQFEIEDYFIEGKYIFVTVLKDGLFSRDITLDKRAFDFYVRVKHRFDQFGVITHLSLGNSLSEYYKEGSLITTDLYKYIQFYNLVPQDIIQFEK